MKKIIVLLVLSFYSTISFSQEGNLWSAFFERAITLNDNNEYEEAEEQFRKAQQLLLEEFGLNEITYSTYCHILYRRAHNLFLIDGMQDSSYVCFKELYDLSKTPIDTVSGNWFRVESMIMLSTIDLERGNIRECCALLESEKQMIDNLDFETRLPHKYYYYKNLTKAYNCVIVNLIPGKESDYQFLNSQYVIVRDGSFYEEHIAAYKELVNLSQRFNKGDVSKITEDLTLLAEHYRIPDDEYLALKTFERAFLMWKNIEDHKDITYLRLCKSYLSYRNNAVFHLDPIKEQKIIREFDSIITSEGAFNSFSYIELMDLYSVRLQDNSLNNTQKEFFATKISGDLATVNNSLILYYICGDTVTKRKMGSIINIKVLIRYLSLCSVYYYELEENGTADLLLNKAKFFSFLLPDGDKLLLEELNNAIAKSAEYIGDEETSYSYQAINITSKVARGIIPTSKESLMVRNYGQNSKARIANFLEEINWHSNKYDRDLLEYYLGLANAYMEDNCISLADESIAKADSITKLMKHDGDVMPYKVRRDFLFCKAKREFSNSSFSKAKLFAAKANEKGVDNEVLMFLADLSINNNRELDSIVSTQYNVTKSFILYSYPFLSERERILFSQSRRFWWFSNIPRFADKFVDDTLLLSMAYNSALISKGTNIGVYTAIVNKARKDNKNELEKFLQQNIMHVNDTNDVVYNNRTYYLEVLEKEMQRFSDVSPEYLKQYFGGWKEISSHLSDNDVAIEFVEYVPIESDNLYLGALYVTKNNRPRIVRICNVAEIDSLKTYFNEKGLKGLFNVFDVVWQPVLKETPNAERIWFSPSLHLFQINIESVLPDSIDAYRVSTTRDIFTLNDAPDYMGIALFGGLNYDEKDAQEEEEIPNLTALNIIRGSSIDEERVGLTYLKGSLNEVLSAKKSLSSVNNDIQLFVDKIGTEDHFKKLSGQGVSLLHIATHGFFIKNGGGFSNVDNRVMRKSGLFMSGAKTIWKGSNEKYFGDDGILLSEEIESLDFSKLNLVVLSACGTGLGNPTNDGVYGLQRAFKKAGAQTIIMSLWNVDDNATALMMETFYQELVKTNSKHQAFKKAQNAVREIFEEPFYWSAFIMLD